VVGYISGRWFEFERAPKWKFNEGDAHVAMCVTILASRRWHCTFATAQIASGARVLRLVWLCIYPRPDIRLPKERWSISGMTSWEHSSAASAALGFTTKAASLALSVFRLEHLTTHLVWSRKRTFGLAAPNRGSLWILR